MTIRSISNPYGPQRAATPAPTTPAKQDGAAVSTSPASAVAPRKDSVAISDAGRALSKGASSKAGSLTPERVADLRKKVLEGAYNSTPVVDAVAKRLLSTGDV